MSGEIMLTPIALARAQEPVTVTGVIRKAASEVIGNSPSYRWVLADGSGEIDLLFLGWPAVAGLEPGRRCTASGTPCVYQEKLVIWNPRYDLAATMTPCSNGGRLALPRQIMVVRGGE